MKTLKIVLILIGTLNYSAYLKAQCPNAKEDYEKLICKIDSIVESSYDTIKSQWGNSVTKQIININNKNCKNIEEAIVNLDQELKNNYKSADFKLNELAKTYVNSLQIYVNSLRDLTQNVGDRYSISSDQYCASNYQQSQTAKGQLLNYIHFLEMTPPPPITNKFQFFLGFGSSFSSIEKNLLASTTSLNYDSTKSINKNRLFYDFSFGYKVSDKFRAGFGINNIPETSIGYKNGSSDIEENIHGTSVRIIGNYLLLPYKKENFGFEVSLIGGIIGSFVNHKRSLSSYNTDSSTSVNYSTIATNYYSSDGPFSVTLDSTHIDSTLIPSTTHNNILIDNEYSHQINTLGIVLSLQANIYLNKNISFCTALSGMLNSKIKIPEQSYGLNNSEKIPQQSISFSAFSVSVGMAVHF